MKLEAAITGRAWVTPLGSDLAAVSAQIDAGVPGEIELVQDPLAKRPLRLMRVPSGLVAEVSRLPRLRRSSAISLYAVEAALRAVEMAGSAVGRTAVIVAVSSASVVYTHRFYRRIVEEGARGASPALFPETVHNAPASHVAAALGIDGASYTLVGDGTVGFSALHMAAGLLRMDEADRCVVVGAEEVDVITAEAYRTWRFGGVYSEGAGAVVLERAGGLKITTHPGTPFTTRTAAAAALDNVLDVMEAEPDLVVYGASAGEIGRLEQRELAARGLLGVSLRQSLGDALGAASLFQIIQAVNRLDSGKRALVCGLGINLQAGAAALYAES